MRRSVVFLSLSLSGACWLAGCSGNIADPNGPAPADGTDQPSTGGGPKTPGATGPKGPGTTTPGADPTPTGPPPVTATGCAKPGQLGSSPLRRLTNEEYNSTVADLLGIADLRPADAFTQNGQVGGLSNNVSQQALSGAIVEGYFSAAERLSAKAAEDVTKLMGCDPAGAAEAACAKDFIARLGERAFRRPLTTEETATFQKVFTDSRAGADAKSGARGVVEAMLVSPQFLFRTETASSSSGGVETLDGWSVASRLSYTLWGTMPDSTLFMAARDGKLATAEQVAAQADRMLKDPRAVAAARRLYTEWLETDGLDDAKKDAKAFPNFTKQLPSMQKEMARFLEYVFSEKDGSLEALFTSNVGFVDAELAKVYGVDGVTGTDLKQVTLPDRRAGYLTRAGFYASVSSEAETNLVHRGFFVREQLLCQPVSPPPPNVAKLPPADPKRTTRERFAIHKTDATCAGCHTLMDPIGLALENYDAAGGWRDKEGEVTIDDGGELTLTAKDGSFKGAAGLGKALAGNPTAQDCAVQVFFRNAFGRVDEPADKCTMDVLKQRFAASGFKTKDLLKAMVETDAFRFRPTAN